MTRPDRAEIARVNDMARTARRRLRNEEQQPAAPAAAVTSKYCLRCPAYPLAIFRHGALTRVELHHTWGACGGAVETLLLADFGWRDPRPVEGATAP